jgi:hypothetical protein
MIKKIVCFDFDKTLINTPTPELGKSEWEKTTGMQWSGKGWWGNAESLNTKVFNLTINSWVYKFYEKYINDLETYCFLATGRLHKLEKQVLDVLNLHSITFTPSEDNSKGVYCNTGGETYKFKTRLFEQKIKQFPMAEEFIIFDDRYEHLIMFEDWANDQSITVRIIDVINKKEFKTNKNLNNII